MHIRGLLWHSVVPPASTNAGPAKTTCRLPVKQKEEDDTVFADASSDDIQMRTSHLISGSGAHWSSEYRSASAEGMSSSILGRFWQSLLIDACVCSCHSWLFR